VVFIANLAPRKMRFGLSEGMILSAGFDGGALACWTPTPARSRACRCAERAARIRFTASPTVCEAEPRGSAVCCHASRHFAVALGRMGSPAQGASRWIWRSSTSTTP
jgi:hypothetical protein